MVLVMAFEKGGTNELEWLLFLSTIGKYLQGLKTSRRHCKDEYILAFIL